MYTMDQATFKKLEKDQKNIKITMYLPIEGGAQNTANNTSLFRHAQSLLNKTFREESVNESDKLTIRKSLEPIYQKIKHGVKGNGLFIVVFKDLSAKAYSLDFKPEPSIYFELFNMQLEPLKISFNNRSTSWLLAISQNGCRLFQNIGNHVTEVIDVEISQGVKSLLMLDETKVGSQSHPIGQANGVVNEANHGHGGYKDQSKIYLEQYLKIIDGRLLKHGVSKSANLVLTGSQFAQQAFKKVSKRSSVIGSKHFIRPELLSLSDVNRLARINAPV